MNKSSAYNSTSTFMCVKCRCRQSIIKEGYISNSSFMPLFPSQQSKYAFVSCANCGYTEIYNIKILQQNIQKET
ncbi:MAG: zinc ribbon domain-containing protein [Bacillaceae bacterium]